MVLELIHDNNNCLNIKQITTLNQSNDINRKTSKVLNQGHVY